MVENAKYDFFANLSQRPRWPFLIKICPLSDVVIVFCRYRCKLFTLWPISPEPLCQSKPNLAKCSHGMKLRILQFVKLNVDLKSFIFFIYLFIYFLWLGVGWGHNSGLKYFILINRGKSKKFYFKKRLAKKAWVEASSGGADPCLFKLQFLGIGLDCNWSVEVLHRDK